MNIEQARFNMIEQQIRPWNVLDQDVLDLLHGVKREQFVPEAYQNLAFADVELDDHRAPMVFGADPDDALGYVAGMQSGLLDDLDPATRADALAALRADLVAHHDAQGVRYDSATWIVRARRA